MLANGTEGDGTAVSSTEKVALLVLGMHRSGTSALARILALAGAKLPQNLVAAGEGNETGHWEPVRIALLNDKIMKSLDHSWLDWTQLNVESLPVEDRRTFNSDIRSILLEEYGGASVVVFKEPRACRLAETYIQSFKDLGYRPVPIIIFRNPLEVVDSLMARSSWPPSRTEMDAAILWLVHVLEAEHASRGTDRVFWNYDDLFGSWQELIELLRRRGNVEFPVSSDALALQVGAFLDPSLHHHRQTAAALQGNSLTSGWFQETYGALQVLISDPHSVHAISVLDRVRTAFISSQPLLERSLQERMHLSSILDESKAAQSVIQAELIETTKRYHEHRIAAQKKISAQAAESLAVESRYAALQNQSDALQKELAAHQVAIQGIWSSRSWRITAPIRHIRPVAIKAIQGLITLGRTTTSLDTPAENGSLKAQESGSRITSAENDPTSISYEHSFDKRDDFVNSALSRRKDTLLSHWHRKVVEALSASGPVASEGPSLGLSLVTYNSAKWLPGFFESLRAQNFPLCRLNVVFVDNDSTDSTVELIEAERNAHGARFASFRLYRRPNLGFGSGHHYAIQHLDDEFLIVSNVDTNFHSNTISGLWRAALADEADIASWEVRQWPYEHPKYYDPVTLETSWSSHACILLRKHAYDDVGGYDQRLFMYGEDVELSYRLRGKGWRLRYLPQVMITHFVDFEDTTSRPHQVSNSIAANVLLRYRYGDVSRAIETERQLHVMSCNDTDVIRRGAIAIASVVVDENREHFSQSLRPTSPSAFPFRGFDYDISRIGHNVPAKLQCSERQDPLVSVITRTHGEKIGPLSEAIASVLNQSYKNIEHLVVEDRTDFAGPLVAAAQQSYNRKIDYYVSDGSGRSRAGNYGLERARGDYIMFLDNDDLLFSDHVETLARELSHKQSAIAAYTLAWEVKTQYADDGTYKELSHFAHASHQHEFDVDRLLNINFIPIQCIMFRRSAYDRLGGFNEALDLLEDWNLWARYAQHGNFSFVRKLTSLYRIPGDEELRRRRQIQMDSVYAHVRDINLEDSEVSE